MGFVEPEGDPLESCFFRTRSKRPRVGDDVRDAEHLSPLQFNDKRVDRFLPKLVVGAGQVDQVRVVRDRVRDAMLVECRSKLGDVVVGDRLGPPLVVVLGEKLHAIAARLVGSVDRLVITARHRHVCTENCHTISLAVGVSPANPRATIL